MRPTEFLPTPLRLAARHWRRRQSNRDAVVTTLQRGLPAAARREWLKRLLGPEPQWVFIAGVNNSGTTLLSKLFKQHPDLANLPSEGHHLSPGLPSPGQHRCGRRWTTRRDIFRWTASDGPTDTTNIKLDWARQFEGPPRGRLLVEKSPPNIIRMLWLQRHFEPAHILVVTRSPYAVAEGVRRRTGATIAQAATHWATAMSIASEDRDSLKNWHHLAYESLVADPLAAMPAVTHWLGISDLPASVFDKTIAVHNSDNTPSRIQDFNAKSMARLSAQEIDTITKICGDVMGRWGYEPA